MADEPTMLYIVLSSVTNLIILSAILLGFKRATTSLPVSRLRFVLFAAVPPMLLITQLFSGNETSRGTAALAAVWIGLAAMDGYMLQKRLDGTTDSMEATPDEADKEANSDLASKD